MIISEAEKIITEMFHKMYYNSPHTWNQGNTRWMGVPCFQNPLDMWIFQEIIFETKPTIIIECGSALGGGSLFFAQMMEAAGTNGKVLSIDVESKRMVDHSQIKSFVGRSIDLEVFRIIKSEIANVDRVMVVLDSDHSTENVLSEMRLYGPLVTPGCYMVVCDSNLGGNPIENLEIGSGPMKAIRIFMKENDKFGIDTEREKFYFTFFPSGWLRKK
jgi:cephalosporin hydroxylase